MLDCLISNNSTYCDGGFPLCGSAGGIEVYSWGFVERCHIISNFAANSGGGVILAWGTGGSLVMRDCVIQGNHVNGFGAGVYIYNGGRLVNCTIADNVVNGTGNPNLDKGGGIFANYGGGVEGCTISGNFAPERGGGVYLSNGSTILVSRILGNSVISNCGGGLLIRNSSLANRCLIASNMAPSGGGCWGETTEGPSYIRNCVIRDNTASNNGGGLQLDSGIHVENCTVVSNRAGGTGGGIVTESADVGNTIVYYNVAPAGSNWSGSAAASWGHMCTTPVVGINPVTNAPAFQSLATRDLRLTSTSRCVDAGMALPAIIHDYDGVPRPLDGNADGTNRLDIGAYEYVSAVADTDGDGLTDSNEVYVTGANPTLPDTDQDGSGDGDEFTAGTDPTNPLSIFQVDAIEHVGTNCVFLQSASNRFYALDCQPPEAAGQWTPVTGQTNVAGDGDPLMLTDSSTTSTCLWYRVRVRRLGVPWP